jgi:hypothetical protein
MLIRDVATKAKNYGERPFLVPDLATGQGHSIKPDDTWLPKPMTYSRFVDLMRTLIRALGGWEKPEPPTFNALRRLMPTGADVLQFSDTVAAAIGNWQDTPKGDSDRTRGRMKDQMAKRYAGEKIKTAGLYKLQVVAAIWDVRGEENQGGDGWTRMRQEYSDKKALKRMINDFRMEGPMNLGGDEPKCLPRLPKGPLKHRREGQLRVVPPLEQIAWLMQSAQRPWVHFAAGEGLIPFCRSTKFRRDPTRQGRGILEAARTGERPCPRCVPLMGDKAEAVMAEFYLADSAA